MSVGPRKLIVHLAAAGSVLLMTGCHSAFIQTTVTNSSERPIHLFEVDYPNASFGAGDLAPGATFHYRFKVLGEGSTKLTWTDAAEKEHSTSGPKLREGQEGTLRIEIGPSTATWDADLHQVR